MAEDVKSKSRVWLLALVACHPFLLHAQTLLDPTRPPVAVLAAEKPADGGAAERVPEEQPLQLEMVMVRPGEGAWAMINGEWLKRGDRLRGRQVMAIREAEVELRGAQGVEILRMAPIMKKFPVALKSRWRQDKNN